MLWNCVRAARGAVCIDENTKQNIGNWARTLIKKLLAQNGVKEKHIISIIFSQTSDITEENPARAIREIGFKKTALFCTQEPYYQNSPSLIVRVLLTYRAQKWKKTIPVYLNGAEKLRKDIFLLS